MGTPVNRGDDNPQLQRQIYTWDWRRGLTYSEDWKGINPTKMIQKWNGKVYGVSGARMTMQNSMAELALEWSGDPNSGGGNNSTSAKELTIDRWEIPEPKTEKPIVSHPRVYDAFYRLAAYCAAGPTDEMVGSLIAQFKKGIANDSPAKAYTVGEKIVDGWFIDKNFPGWSSLDGGTQGYIIRMYNKVLNDQTHYQDSLYALRHTTNAPSYWTANIADANTNCIYTTAQLLSEAQNSSFWALPLPDRMAYKISAAASAFTSGLPAPVLAAPGYMVGWMKSPFGESSVGRDRVEIQGGYVLDLWGLDTYFAAA